MTYSHSLSARFYVDEGDDELAPKDFATGRLPATVHQAIIAMPEEDYQTMCREVFGRPDVDVDEILAKIEETDTVGDLSSPVDVWIDEEGFWTLDVYE